VARENLIRVSEKEMELIESVREKEFSTDEVPLGLAISVACEEFIKQ